MYGQMMTNGHWHDFSCRSVWDLMCHYHACKAIRSCTRWGTGPFMSAMRQSAYQARLHKCLQMPNSKIQLRETNIPPPRVPAPAPVCPGPLIPVIPVSHSKLQGTSLHRSYILTCLQRANGMPWAIQRSPLELVDLILWTLRWRDFALICKWHAMATGKHPQALVTSH